MKRKKKTSKNNETTDIEIGKMVSHLAKIADDGFVKKKKEKKNK